MSFAKILVPLTGCARDSITLASAFAAAQPFRAHVLALFVRPDPAEAMPFFGEGVSGSVVQEMADVSKAAVDKLSEDARGMLATAASSAGASIVDKPARAGLVTSSYRELEGNFAHCVTRAAQLSDFVVFGPRLPNEEIKVTEAFESVLLEAGRPVLLAAEIASERFGSRIAIGCDGGVPSAHAVVAALPFLKQAETVELFTIQRGAKSEGYPSEVREYLGLHGIFCTERLIEGGRCAPGEAVLAAAEACRADLLVLGCYGHSRLRQAFIGGVTKHVVNHPVLPIFLVH